MSEVISSKNLIEDYASRITQKWRNSVESIIDTGKLLLESSQNLSPKEFQTLVEQLPMSFTTIQKLISIGQNNYLEKQVKHLPPHWTTIYEISTLDKGVIEEGISTGFIHPSSSSKDIKVYLSSPKEPKPQKDNLEKSRLGVVETTGDFNLEDIDKLERDLKKIEDKYGVIFRYDTSKSGVIALRRRLLSLQIDKLLEKRKKKYNKTKLTPDDIQLLEDTFQQINSDFSYHTKPDGSFIENDIRHPDHPYHGWSRKDLYDFCKKNLILTRWTRVREIDKESFVYQMIKEHCDGDSQKRSDAKKRLQRLVTRGNEISKKYATWGLDQLIEGNVS